MSILCNFRLVISHWQRLHCFWWRHNLLSCRHDRCGETSRELPVNISCQKHQRGSPKIVTPRPVHTCPSYQVPSIHRAPYTNSGYRWKSLTSQCTNSSPPLWCHTAFMHHHLRKEYLGSSDSHVEYDVVPHIQISKFIQIPCTWNYKLFKFKIITILIPRSQLGMKVSLCESVLRERMKVFWQTFSA